MAGVDREERADQAPGRRFCGVLPETVSNARQTVGIGVFPEANVEDGEPFPIYRAIKIGKTVFLHPLKLKINHKK